MPSNPIEGRDFEVIDVLREGDFFGEVCIFSEFAEDHHGIQFRTTRSTSVLWISKLQFKDLMNNAEIENNMRAVALGKVAKWRERDRMHLPGSVR